MKEMICMNCGTVGKPKKHTKGSMLTELFLWLLMVLPGLLYSFWRMSSKTMVCKTCGDSDLLPVDCPKGKRLVNQMAAE